MRYLLSQYPAGKIKVFVLWTPLLQSDTRSLAEQSSGYLPDPRAVHFWDLWRYSVTLYTQFLKYPAEELAWDLFIFYKPHISWRDPAPEPSVWMQSRGLTIGRAYSFDELRKELDPWIH